MTKQRRIKKFGWQKDAPDFRDRDYEALKVMPLPPRVDLRSECPPIYDQKNLGSCVGNAVAAAHDFERCRQGQSFMDPSRLFIYFNARDIQGNADYDSGAQIRDGIKSIVGVGVCPESDWPYDISRFTEKPTPLAYSLAEQNQALQYRRITFNNIVSMMQCLALGLPFVFGFTCYESFDSDEVVSSGVLPMPNVSESVIGGHAVMGVGYDRSTKRFLVRNSYGTDFGEAGYFWMDMDYLANPQLAADFWVISKVEV